MQTTSFGRKTYVIASFVTGFSLMVLELLASRIIAPLLGASLYSWTSVIGTTLIGLTIGSVLGGVLADKEHKHSLSYVLIISSACVFLLKGTSLHATWISEYVENIAIVNILTALYLFLAPTLLLGMIQPLIIKRYITEHSHLGKGYGILSGAWSLGSVLGVFMTGFMFFTYSGSIAILTLLSVILALLAGYFAEIIRLRVTFFILACLFLLSSFIPKEHSAALMYSKETPYYKVEVADLSIPGYGPSRALFLDFDIHSLESHSGENHNYTALDSLFEHMNNNPKNILVLGGGAYTLPKNFTKRFPRASVSVMELDKHLVAVGKEYFGLDTHRIKTIIGDAKVLLPKDKAHYDIIFGDTYNSLISVPWYLLTKEWNDTVKTKLTDQGVYAINFIGAVEGEESALTKSIIATFTQTFPHHYIYLTNTDRRAIQNIVVIGMKHSLTETQEKHFVTNATRDSSLTGELVTTPLDTSGANILTDDFSPTENLMKPLLTKYYHAALAVRKLVY